MFQNQNDEHYNNYYSTARNNLRNYFYYQAQGNCNMNLKSTKLKVDKRYFIIYITNVLYNYNMNRVRVYRTHIKNQLKS